MFQNFCRQVFDLGIKDLKNRKAIDIKKTDCISGLIRRQTIQNIERIAERVLIQDIHRKKETGFLQGKTPEEQYRFYHEKWLDCRENVYKILKEFPELARLLFMEIQCNYELADESGIIEYKSTVFICDDEHGALCLGDMSDESNVLSIPLAGGGTLKVNRNNKADLARAIGMFKPEDIRRIMVALAQDNKVQEMENEIEDEKNSIGTGQEN